MSSSNNIPHIYSNRAEFVGASDWNNFTGLCLPTVIDHTDSPFDLTNDIKFLIVKTDGGAVTVNLPETGEHEYIIRNWGSLANDVTLVSDDDIENDTIANDECFGIIYEGSLGWVTISRV